MELALIFIGIKFVAGMLSNKPITPVTKAELKAES